ncbi:hypothetical protein [Corynebacterium yonathiae]|uniref:Uncharacterized protein n=1 Tax=Corynebacterium yonathiae TaxID=2913504 RepID=A0A9X3RN67_9CORY|nr:hypothetical protein [Corynebacterium yonathiae]MCZ9297007.1 hypothetical protein [Corynebacterium yonathiae]
MHTQTTNNRPERREPTHKELAYWQDVAAKRIRLCWATGAFGFMIGFIFCFVISVPPVWM